MSEEVKKSSSLGFKEKFQIVQWLGCQQERLKKEKPRYVEVCKWVLDELKLEIKPTSLRIICTDAGIVWKQKPNAAAGGLGPVWDVVRQLQEAIKSTQDQVIQLMQQQEQVRAQLAEIRGSISTSSTLRCMDEER